MPPKKRTLSPVRAAARKPVRTTDASKPGTKKATNIRSLSPTRNYSGPKPATSRLGPSTSNVSSDDSAGSGAPLWRMPRRGGSGQPQPAQSSAAKKQPKKFNSMPGSAQAPSKQQTMKWQRNPPSHSEGNSRGRTGRRPNVVIDISSSEEDSDDDSDSSIEILVPPKPQSAQVLGARTPVRTPIEKRKSLPDRTISMSDGGRPTKTTARGLSPKPSKSSHEMKKTTARGLSPKPSKSSHEMRKTTARGLSPKPSKSSHEMKKTTARGLSPKPSKSSHEMKKTTARGLSPKPTKSSHEMRKTTARGLSPKPTKSSQEIRPMKRMNSLNAVDSSPKTPSDRSGRSRTIGERNRGRSHSPVLFKDPSPRTSKGTQSKRGPTGSPVIHESPSKQKKTVSASNIEKQRTPEVPKKEPVRPVSPVVPNKPNAYPTLSPLVKEKQSVASNRRQSTAVDGRAPVRERSPNRSGNLPGRRVASMATEEVNQPPPSSRPSNPPPQRNTPSAPQKAGFANGGPTMSAPPIGKVDPRRMSTAVDGRPVRDRSPMRNQIPGRRVASIATEDTRNTTVPPRSQLDLGGGRSSSGSQMPGRRVASMAADERPSIRNRLSTPDDMQPPRRRSTATEDMPDRRSGRSVRMGGSGARPHSSRSPPRSSGGRGRGQHHRTEYDSIHHMPASLQNRYGAQLGRFASSGGRGSGARGGRSVFSGRVTRDGRKVPTQQVKHKPKVVIPVGGTPYSAAGRPVAPNAGHGARNSGSRQPQSQPQSVRVTAPTPMNSQPSVPKGRTKRRDSGGTMGSAGSATRGSGSRSPPNVPRPLSPVADPGISPTRKKVPKIRTEPFMFPIDNPDIMNEIIQPGGSVRVLICSANLGNAQPDELSLSEWVPEDGSMRYVLTTPQRYPVMLNFPTEEKKEDYVATDRAVYHSNHTRPSQLLTINEHEFDMEEDDSEIFALGQTEFISLPSSEIVIETVDEDADDDDMSVINEDTLEVTRIIRKSISELGQIDEETPPKVADAETPSGEVEEAVDKPAEAVEELEQDKPGEVTEEPEPEEPQDAALLEKEESLSETEPVEQVPEQTTPEDEGQNLQADIKEDKSWIDNSDGNYEIEVPRRTTASSKKLDSIRQRIEASIKKSRTDGFEFGEAFHARQKSRMETERLKSQEAKVRLHLGSMAPDSAVSAGESFVDQQTQRKVAEREKAREAKAMMTRGSLGVVGHNSMRFKSILEEDNFQAVPAQIRVASPVPESDETGEAKGSNRAEVDSKNAGMDENDAKDDKDQNDAGAGHDTSQGATPDEVVKTGGSQQAPNETTSTAPVETSSQSESGVSKGAATPDEHGAENVDEANDNSESKDPVSSVVQPPDKKSDEVDILEPNNQGIPHNDKNVDAVDWEDDGVANDDGHEAADNDHGGSQLDTAEDWQNNYDVVEPEPYYEEGPDDNFEIIVIGMQEATFDPNEDPNAKESVGASDRTTMDGSDSDASDDEEDEEGSDDDDDDDDDDEDDEGLTGSSDDEGLAGSSDEDEDYDPPSSSKSMNGDVSPTRGKRLLQGVKNAGKKTLRVGGSAMKKGKKKLKAAKKTSKAVKTLMSAKNHTKRELPFMREEEDGAMASWEDTDVLHFLFDGQLPSYERALSYQLGEMRLLVYYLKSSVDLDVLSVKAKPTGKHGLANKGGIVTEVSVNRSTRLCFSSAHLEAHEGAKKFEKRCHSFERIFNAVNSSVTAIKFDPTMASHYSFFMGDLNFRTKLPSLEAGSEEHIQASHELTGKKKWDVLNRHDELSNALADKKCLAGWKTPYCNFDPTFKVSREDGYRYNPLRSPSYTDRILYKAVDQLEDALEVSLYEPITHFTSSDHKPVRGAFEVQLTETLDLKPRIPTKKKEKLQILFTSIELSLDSDKYKPNKKAKSEDETVKPNPFVSFISTPRDALELDASSRKRSTWKRFGLKKKPLVRTKPGRTKSNVTEAMFNPLSAQWPGTSVLEGTFTPKWEAEEIHFELGTKNKTNNRPLDLSGALMHVSVFDGRDSNPKLLGSFTLNLASLIKTTIESENNRRGSVRHARAMGMKADSGKSYERRLSRQPSSRLNGLITSLADELENDSQEKNRLKQLKITTLNFDEVLVDSGVQTGTIKCTVDAWWMQEDEEE